ncbi:MAG: ATP/GTP-binding protein [Candidatus Hermodarchaeota archaeon]
MKIVVLGPYNSGKSTFIHKICLSSAFSVDKSGTTVALDHGVVTAFGIAVFLFGTPGLKRFEVVRQILSEGADGAIMVVDAANEVSINEAKSIYAEFLKIFSEQDVPPLLIFANKQDKEEAISPEELLKRLAIPESKVVNTIGGSALTGEGIGHALRLIVIATMNQYKKILEAIDKYGRLGVKEITNNTKLSEEKTRSMLQWLSWRQLVLADWDSNLFALPPRVREIIEILDYAKMIKGKE